MNFLNFKKKFIELYNQQKFKHFDKDLVNLLLALKFEEVDAPSLYVAVNMAMWELPFTIKIDKAKLNAFLGELLAIKELKFSIDYDATTFKLHPMRDLSKATTSSIARLNIWAMHSSPLTGVLEPKPLITVGKLVSRLNASQIYPISSAALADKFVATANMTFFSNFILMETELKASLKNIKFNWRVSPAARIKMNNLAPGVKYTSGMRSHTEYYISHYDDGTTINQVSNLTLYEFAYNEI